MVDVIVSANGAREEVGGALRRLLGSGRDDHQSAVAGAPLAPGA
jgi:hypothetical protein